MSIKNYSKLSPIQKAAFELIVQNTEKRKGSGCNFSIKYYDPNFVVVNVTKDEQFVMSHRIHEDGSTKVNMMHPIKPARKCKKQETLIDILMREKAERERKEAIA